MENESNKQISVEWLFKQLWDEPKDKLTWYAILKQAKEWHKQEIEDAFWDGCYHWENEKNAEDYYAETYGKKTFIDLVSDEKSQVHEVIKKLKNKKIQGGNK
jgi:hypothetical protein